MSTQALPAPGSRYFLDFSGRRMEVHVYGVGVSVTDGSRWVNVREVGFFRSRSIRENNWRAADPRYVDLSKYMKRAHESGLHGQEER